MHVSCSVSPGTSALLPPQLSRAHPVISLGELACYAGALRGLSFLFPVLSGLACSPCLHPPSPRPGHLLVDFLLGPLCPLFKGHAWGPPSCDSWLGSLVLPDVVPPSAPLSCPCAGWVGTGERPWLGSVSSEEAILDGKARFPFWNVVWWQCRSENPVGPAR